MYKCFYAKFSVSEDNKTIFADKTYSATKSKAERRKVNYCSATGDRVEIDRHFVPVRRKSVIFSIRLCLEKRTVPGVISVA